METYAHVPPRRVQLEDKYYCDREMKKLVNHISQ